MPRTIVLAYSGGLDTSIIVPWLREHYDARVVCVAANIGQDPEELRGVREKAIASGADDCFIEDLREEFVRDFIFPTLRTGAVYNRKYLLGTAMARPLIAKRQVEIARRVGADALAHGCTVISFASGAKGINKSVCGDKLIVVPDGDGKEMANKIILQLRKERTATPESFFNYYSWENITEKAALEIASFLTKNA